MSTSLRHEIYELARSVAISARELIVISREKFTAEGFSIPFEVKSSSVDPVTVVDKTAENHIRNRISAARPHDGFLGEEYGYTPSESGIDWIIDPIDGTVNFLYGLPTYSVSIAAAAEGEVIAAAVIDIVHNTLYSAGIDLGSFRSDLTRGEQMAITPSAVETLKMSLMGTGFSYDEDIRRFQGKIFASLIPQVRDVRRLGSAAIDLCLVASGGLDIYYEYALKPWDFAAGAFIAVQAGAKIHTPQLTSYLHNSNTGPIGRESLVWAVAPGLESAWSDAFSLAGLES